MRLLLKNLRVCSKGSDRRADLRLARGRIAESGRGLIAGRRERMIDGRGALALPGLINAHDHLGLDLLPRLGAPPYTSFYDWARDVYRPTESPIVDVMRVDLDDRLIWGGYRNLISGVTTVAHHDPPYRALFRHSFPVRVLERYEWSHSLGLGEDPVRAYGRRNRGAPFFIHAAEGTDQIAASEIGELDRLGMLGSATVLVHAIGASAEQTERIAAAGAAVVWCPASNLWLYERTVDVAALGPRTRVVIGTDSTLSGSSTLFDELRVAAATGLASPDELLAMVTTEAAEVLRCRDGRGTLEVGGPADVILLAEDDEAGPGASLLRASPPSLALVTIAGRPRLARQEVAEQLGLQGPNVCLDGEAVWLAGDFLAVRDRIRERIDEVDVLGASPLWIRMAPLTVGARHASPSSSGR